MDLSKFKIDEVHISLIRVGDTVLHSDGIRTVGIENLKRSSFMGVSLFGDCYKLGRIKVKKIII